MAFDCLNGGMDEIHALSKHLGLRRGQRVLDVGCGLGGPARLLANKFGVRVEGIDLSDRQVVSAGRLTQLVGLQDSVACLHADAAAIPFAMAQFDAAYAIESLVHVDAKDRAIAEIHRVLKPGGIFILLDYVRRSPAPEIERLFPVGYHPWQEGECAALLSHVGFTVLSSVERSAQLARSYELFAQLFDARRMSPRAVVFGLSWWLSGNAGAIDAWRRLNGYLSFLVQRQSASRVFLGRGYDAVLTFCRAQAQACRVGAVQYWMTVARKTLTGTRCRGGCP